MLRQVTAVVLCLAAHSASVGADSPGTVPVRNVPWREVKLALTDLVCLTSEDGHPVAVSIGYRPACGPTERIKDLERAIDQAFADAGLFYASLNSAERIWNSISQIADEKKLASARSAFLADERGLSVLLPRVNAALGRAGMRCSDCPEASPKPARTVSWSEFAPYIGAFFWPDEVKDSVSSDGVRTPHYTGYKVCFFSNGTETMEKPDAELARAGFVLAREDVIAARGSLHYHEAVRDDALRQMTSNEERTLYLRRAVPRSVASDPLVREAACKLLPAFVKDLGIEVADCPESVVVSPSK